MMPSVPGPGESPILALPTAPSPLLSGAAIIARKWRICIGLPLAIGFVIGVVGLFSGRTYTVEVGFVPQISDQGLSAAASLASEVGISLPSGDLTQSPDFYAMLVGSRPFVGSVVETKYVVPTDSGPRKESLIDYFELTEKAPGRARAEAIDAFDHTMNVRTETKTGLVRVSVSEKDSTVAFQIAQRILELVNQFNTQTRQTQVGQERRFLETQTAEALSALRQAEDSLESFSRTNRDVHNDPTAVLQQQRLERSISMRQTEYTLLDQQYEQAKVEEVRNTPKITLVFPPAMPDRPDRRGLVVLVLVTVILVFMAVVAMIFAVEYWSAISAGDPAAMTTLRSSSREAFDTVKGAGSQLGRVIGLGRARRDSATRS